MHYVSILSTVVTFAFAIAVLNRYARRGGAPLLLWGIGLVFYGLGTLTEAVMIFFYNPLLLKLWYLTGAMLTAAWLGQGTLHLLVRRQGVATKITYALAAVSLISAWLVFSAPVVPGAAYDLGQTASTQYKDILTRPALMIILTILLNIYGSVLLVGGALYSAFLFWRKKVLANRLFGNFLIAAGALMPAMGGTFIRAGLPDWLYVSEFLGSVLMFAGFLLASSSQQAPEAQRAAAAAK